MSEDTTKRWREGMAAILGELEQLYAADAIGAVQINIALRDGNVRTMKAHDNGFRILLIAAAAIGHHETIDRAAQRPDAGNWSAPGPLVPPPLADD